MLDGLIRAQPDIHRARRTVSRPASDATEAFESVDAAAFARLRDSGAFALHWEAHGLGYGIRTAEFAPLADGRRVIFNGSRRALPQALARYPTLSVISVTVTAASLAARLAIRGRESAAGISERLRRAADLPPGIDARVISNDATPEEGIARLVAACQPVRA